MTPCILSVEERVKKKLNEFSGHKTNDSKLKQTSLKMAAICARTKTKQKRWRFESNRDLAIDNQIKWRIWRTVTPPFHRYYANLFM